MKIRRFSFFAAAIALGAASFIWTVQVQGRVSGGPGGTYCPGSFDGGPAETMCYGGTTTIPGVSSQQQSSWLATGSASCGPCPTTAM